MVAAHTRSASYALREKLARTARVNNLCGVGVVKEKIKEDPSACARDDLRLFFADWREGVLEDVVGHVAALGDRLGLIEVGAAVGQYIYLISNRADDVRR